ncbi:venom protease [Haematobia irritans]|uniref:venom protease n=1 Tax=Haematobia irritans TaxID=7368 RepID=UPI003F4FEB6B
MIVIHQIVCVIVALFLVHTIQIEGRKRNHHKNQDFNIYSYPPNSLISYDYLGNCYVNSIGLSGRCVPYNQCSSAIQKWQYFRQIPYSCSYTGNVNYVCCQEAYMMIISTPFNYRSPTNPFLPADPYGNYKPQERISELECSAIYDSKAPSSKSHRSKRSENVDNITNGKSDEDQTFEPAKEEAIVKEHAKETEIVGGSRTYPNEFPYMCALGWRTSKHAEISYNCGCVLIARKFVITAAHCATLGGESPSVVRLGGVDLEEDQAEVIKIKRITQHPDYDSNLAYNDIAVIKLEKSSRQQPACIWASEGLPQQVLTAIGYGQTKFAGPSSNSLLKVRLNVLTNEDCNTYYKPGDKLIQGVNAGQICAGDPQGKRDTCQGDSGGPLLMFVPQYNTYVPYIVGITSFGEGCASGVPSIYTRISYFIEWIEQEVWK